MTTTLRVQANVDHTDAASGMPRTKDETFDMEETRARLKASQGFVRILEEQAPLAEESDVAPRVMNVKKPVAKKKRKA